MPSNRRKFGLPEESVVILHVAHHVGPWNINHRKGLRYLAEAFVYDAPQISDH
jgi:hypothetical protein